ncbi:MAG: AAA family ATPase [Bacteroidia bacterium]|nr:AAA family ATPase [Bacteroidia bacterium]
MPQRLIPYGNANFEKIITENYYFVDKTKYIAELEKYTCPVFLRPRRFGKSVFTEMLRWYYDIKAKDRFTGLFGNTYIGKNPTAKHNNYFFLSLDFSGMNIYAAENTKEIQKAFNSKIGSSLYGFLMYYSALLKLNEDYPDRFDREFNEDASAKLKHVLELVKKVNGKLYIAIDEYDSLTNALAILYQHTPEGQNEYLNILRKGGFFRGFFEALKDGLKQVINGVYITGILPITIADMNSGFNVADWVTFKPELLNMLGITQYEFEGLSVFA